MVKISTFEDWVDYFRQWQQDIGYDPALLDNYQFETKLGNGLRRFLINPYAMR